MMLKKTSTTRLTITLFALFSIAIMACGGGGGSSPAPTPTLSVLPEGYDFGIVTDSNTVEMLVVTIQNTGAANLSVRDIALSGQDPGNFVLDLDGGTNPCVSAAPTLGTGGSCNVTVAFAPDVIVPTGGLTYSAALTIQSNDPTTPTYNMGLLGSIEDVSEANVTINQLDPINACPRSVGIPVTAYVSVTDQAGFAVTGLDEINFTLSEDGGTTALPIAATFIQNANAPISIALLMDYSFSLTQEPDNVTDMQQAAINLVGQLGNNDEAEIIKFATEVNVVQPFLPASEEAQLIQAIESTPDLGGGETRLYDAIIRAADDLSLRTKDRKAIILITDGEDNDGTGQPLSLATLDQVIADANVKGIPVFTVGLGNRVNPDDLQRMADETGGIFSESVTSDNLLTIYQQLADLLFTNQYILTYFTGLGTDDPGSLVVKATFSVPAGVVSGSDTKAIPACGP